MASSPVSQYHRTPWIRSLSYGREVPAAFPWYARHGRLYPSTCASSPAWREAHDLSRNVLAVHLSRLPRHDLPAPPCRAADAIEERGARSRKVLWRLCPAANAYDERLLHRSRDH